ncbi:hypothetical protein AVEN_173384-1 [Araneus ventricosus]|uniref:Uncharacterized protein n=1 Tax=Araneus ventricosus TaxID=182803 RepID=A0A4Y2TES3_ARAVE|nr:hypothetical protein AVEN_173384-1 [Araneus ventricosus]
MEKENPKSGSLKRKEVEETERKKSDKCCNCSTSFLISQSPSALMSSCETNPHEEKISSHRDDAVMCEPEEQRSITLDTDKKTSMCFANQSRTSTSPFIVPISVETFLATSEVITSTSDRESDALSTTNSLASEADDANEATQELKRFSPVILHYLPRANLRKFFVEHPFQPPDDLPFVARLYERKTMNDTVQRKLLTYKKENKCL